MPAPLIINPALEEAKKKIQQRREASMTDNDRAVIQSGKDKIESKRQQLSNTPPLQIAPTNYADQLKTDMSNSQKRVMYNQWQKLQATGKDPKSAMMELGLANTQIQQSPEYPNFSSNAVPSYANDPEYQTASADMAMANSRLADSKKELDGYAGMLKKRWDTSIKKNLDSLTTMSTDPNYMQFLSGLGVQANDMFSLARGRESYIKSYAETIRQNMNNDLAWMENLKGIKKEAEQDYMNKVRIVNSEVKRIESQQASDEVVNTFTDNTGNVTLLVQNKATGEIYKKPMGIIGQAKTSTVKEAETFKSFNDFAPERTECGEYVNDTIKAPHKYGDLLADKARNVTNKDIDHPKLNANGYAVFVSVDPSSGKYGHTGFVVGVNNDGTIDIIDRNKDGKGTIQRRDGVTPESEYIVGYDETDYGKADFYNSSSSNRLDKLDSTSKKQVQDLLNKDEPDRARALLEHYEQNLTSKQTAQNPPPKSTQNDEVVKLLADKGSEEVTKYLKIMSTVNNEEQKIINGLILSGRSIDEVSKAFAENETKKTAPKTTLTTPKATPVLSDKAETTDDYLNELEKELGL